MGYIAVKLRCETIQILYEGIYIPAYSDYLYSWINFQNNELYVYYYQHFHTILSSIEGFVYTLIKLYITSNNSQIYFSDHFTFAQCDFSSITVFFDYQTLFCIL